MSEILDEKGTAQLAAVCGRCNRCDQDCDGARQVYQLTGPNGYVTLCFVCLVKMAYEIAKVRKP